MATRGRPPGSKSKVTLLPKQTFLRFPVGDPRNDMTEEEIKIFAQREEKEIDVRLGRYVVAPPTNIIEEQEDEESFTVDLENKVVTQVVAEGLIRIPGTETLTLAPPTPIPMLAIQNPYTDMITDAFVYKAITTLVARYVDLEHELSTFGYKVPYESRVAIQAETDRITKKIDDLKWSRSGYGQIIPKVYYDKIPEWAHKEIQELVQTSISELLSLTLTPKARG